MNIKCQLDTNSFTSHSIILKHRSGALTAGRVNVLFQGHSDRTESCQREVLLLWGWSFFESFNLQRVLFDHLEVRQPALKTTLIYNLLMKLILLVNGGLFIYTSSRDGYHLFRASMTSIIFFLDHCYEVLSLRLWLSLAVICYIIGYASSTGALGPTAANWLAGLRQ